jgi:probable HAF family extracellular repeat protein
VIHHDVPGGAMHAFLWSPATGMRDLGALAGNSWAYAINNNGQVVGYTATPQFTDRAFIWSAASGMVALGTLGGRHSYAYAINDSGQVVGQGATAEGDGNQHGHAFIWDESSGMIDLGTLEGSSSVAYGVNDSGQVVGYSTLGDGLTAHAFVWDGSMMRDLSDLIDPSAGLTLKYARGINDSGQIVAIGIGPLGGRHPPYADPGTHPRSSRGRVPADRISAPAFVSFALRF